MGAANKGCWLLLVWMKDGDSGEKSPCFQKIFCFLWKGLAFPTGYYCFCWVYNNNIIIYNIINIES